MLFATTSSLSVLPSPKHLYRNNKVICKVFAINEITRECADVCNIELSRNDNLMSFTKKLWENTNTCVEGNIAYGYTFDEFVKSCHIYDGGTHSYKLCESAAYKALNTIGTSASHICDALVPIAEPELSHTQSSQMSHIEANKRLSMDSNDSTARYRTADSLYNTISSHVFSKRIIYVFIQDKRVVPTTFSYVNKNTGYTTQVINCVDPSNTNAYAIANSLMRSLVFK